MYERAAKISSYIKTTYSITFHERTVKLYFEKFPKRSAYLEQTFMHFYKRIHYPLPPPFYPGIWKNFFPFSSVILEHSSGETPFSSASRSQTRATYPERFRSPRWGTGAI